MAHQITIKGEALPTSIFGTPYLGFDSLTGVERINELVSGKNLFASVVNGISIFAQNCGARLVAAREKLELIAQSDDIELVGDKKVKVLSLKDKVEIVAAKEILLYVNGDYIKITKTGIEHGTKGTWAAYTNEHKMELQKTTTYSLPAFQASNDEAFQILDNKGKPLAGVKYKVIIGDDEEVFRGITDEKGFTNRVNTNFEGKTVKIVEDLDEDSENKEELEKGE